MTAFNKDIFSIFSTAGCLLLLIALSFLDFPGLIGMTVVLIITGLYSFSTNPNFKSYSMSLWITTSFIYLISAYICSLCFSETEFHLASDPIRYIAYAHRATPEILAYHLEQTYFYLQDNNGLYNAVLFGIGWLCRAGGIPASSFILTLLESLFGILTVITVFRVLCVYFTPKKSFYYSLLFGCCSLILAYSCIIVRDIVLTFLFAKAMEIVIKPFSTKGLIYLVIMTIAAFGVRIFSGCFFGIFVVYYIYFGAESRVSRRLVVPLLMVVIMAVASSSFMDEMFTKTSEEIDSYNGWQTDEAMHTSGLSGNLRKLPIGISNIALLLFSQANPFPPYITLVQTNVNLTFPQIYLSVLFTIAAVWWFYVSYSLLYYFFFHKGYRHVSVKMRWLYAIALVLIVVSTHMHVDVRRIMPAYPIIYLLFLLYRHKIEPANKVKHTKSVLFSSYALCNILYLVLKF